MIPNVNSLLAVIAAVVALVVARVVHKSGELRRLEDIVAHTGRCNASFRDAGHFEDWARLDDGTLIGLAGDHSHFVFKLGKSMRTMLREAREARGGMPLKPTMLVIDPSGVPSLIPLVLAPNYDFTPHGIAAIGSRYGGTLIAVNHRADMDQVEFFTFDANGSRATHTRSFSHPLLFNVNDCALPRDEWSAVRGVVICTNWRSGPTGTLRDAAEIYLQQPNTNVVSCETIGMNAGRCVEVANGIRMANGIQVSKDGTRVFVVSSLGKALIVYKRTAAPLTDYIVRWELRPILPFVESHRIPTASACDNLVWEDGSENAALLSGCHPKALSFVRYAKDPTRRRAPCEVVRFATPLAAWHAGATEAIYVDSTGEELSACSAAARDGTRALWLGGVHAPGVLKCASD